MGVSAAASTSAKPAASHARREGRARDAAALVATLEVSDAFSSENARSRAV